MHGVHLRHVVKLWTQVGGPKERVSISASVFIPDIFLEGGIPPKKLTIFLPQTAAKFCALNIFLGRNNELQIYHGQ